MVEEAICNYFNKDKDTLVIKAPKRSPLVLRTVVLLFSMVCGVYICLICLKQITTRTKIKLLNIKVVNQPCQAPDIEESEIPFVHYPDPVTFSREECACNPVRYFAILSMQRSGSGWFETLLNSHVNVSSNGEIFSVRDRMINTSSIVSTMDRVYNLDWFTSASKNACSAAVGFKWMLNQGLMEHHNEIAEYFKRNGVSAIFLFRRNLLRRMISLVANSYDKDAKLLNGTHKSHVHSLAEVLFVAHIRLSIFSRVSFAPISYLMMDFQANILAKYKPTLNSTLILPQLKQIEQTAAKAIKYFNSTRHIVLYYEDLINNRTKLREVQEFLRLPYRELTSRQVKIHSGPLSKQVENWNEVEQALKGTSYESFLHSDYFQM
ncbi:hypothetical protein Dsin_003328 [Dipteronia sinensis]|uniref:Sulfotransferase n=1 Tax=Dipteronia sinensis TaxID=43782 RepID=A0AAE0B8X0_9ROSI|nr:hypothetical protein Dsin_003328 [Dipteronia sinensis]